MPDPLVVTIFLFSSFIVAGIAQTIWLKSRISQRFAKPLDRGRLWHGQPMFGRNKTWRGFVVMVPSVGIMFALLSAMRPLLGPPFANGLWPLSVTAYFFLGCWAGLAFMLGELPNSFLKRQFGIGPGEAPQHRVARAVCFVIDHIDSLLATLIALELFVHLPLVVWIIALGAGLVVHWLFNVALKWLGLKQRAA